MSHDSIPAADAVLAAHRRIYRFMHQAEHVLGKGCHPSVYCAGKTPQVVCRKILSSYASGGRAEDVLVENPLVEVAPAASGLKQRRFRRLARVLLQVRYNVGLDAFRYTNSATFTGLGAADKALALPVAPQPGSPLPL